MTKKKHLSLVSSEPPKPKAKAATKVVTEKDPTVLLEKAYKNMIDSQANFSDIAVNRALQIAQINNINLSQAHILGVSFTPILAIVAVLYKPTILAPNEEPGEKQVNIPVPAECLFIVDDSWIEVYNKKLEDARQEVEKDKDKIKESFENEKND